MKKLLCLALPAVLIAACGSDSGRAPDARPTDVARDAAELDAGIDQALADGGPSTADAPDAPPSPDLPQIIDEMPATDQDDLLLDGPPPLDVPPAIDSADDDAPAIDGPPPPSDARTTTLFNPDGRTISVVVLDYCPMGTSLSSACPSTYAEALAHATSVLDASWLQVKAGRCAEGAYLYIPFTDGLDGQVCYYSSTQQLVGDLYFTDVLYECAVGSGTASRAFAHGEIPPCTDVTWEISK